MLIAVATQASAKDATLVWDPNTEPEVVGYNIYYRTDTPTLPFNGTSLSEGASPIFVDGSANTALTLDLPEDGSIYYFTATAVSDTQIESSFSDTVASEWVPSLLAPPNNAVVNTAATFAWGLPPSSYTVSFDLLYGTDPNLGATTTASSAPGPFNFNWPQNIAIPLAILLSWPMIIIANRKKRMWQPIRVGLCLGIFVLQASCGGGGGGGSDDAEFSPGTSAPDTSLPGIVSPEPNAIPFTNVVTDILDTEYQITDLQPETKYYWKVIAVDNWGDRYESLTQSVTTL
jgi:hypothetical protein